MNPTTTALFIGDLQNDFIHPKGAYARGGAVSPAAAALPARVKPVMEALRAAGGCAVSSHFTLWPGPNNTPLISPHLLKLRPFLRQGDFVRGGWGHAMVDELGTADFSVDKVAYSAFYMTQLEWVLKKRGIDTIMVTGIVTNGGVASTARDAHVRDFHVVVLEDGCAAFKQETHDISIRDLANIGEVMSCADAAKLIQSAKG
ncbi:MAG TPA: cysteine hydrolase [Burkholderiales bacterium]|jgi:nicotinamidase-related amidase